MFTKLLPILLFLSAALGGCYLAVYPATPAVEDQSTYLISVAQGTGTAWVVAPGWLVSAGHVCAAAESSGFTVVMRSLSGRWITGKAVLMEVSDGPGADACLIRADGPTETPLVLMPGPPPEGTPDFVVGYPHGEHARSFGKYLGKDRSSAPIQPGNSGSAVATARGVYMIATHITPEGTTAGTPVAELLNMLDSAGVTGYTMTPGWPLEDPFDRHDE